MNFLFHVLLITLVTKNYDDIDPFHSKKSRNLTPFIIQHDVTSFRVQSILAGCLNILAGIRRGLRLRELILRMSQGNASPIIIRYSVQFSNLNYHMRCVDVFSEDKNACLKPLWLPLGRDKNSGLLCIHEWIQHKSNIMRKERGKD